MKIPRILALGIASIAMIACSKSSPDGEKAGTAGQPVAVKQQGGNTPSAKPAPSARPAPEAKPAPKAEAKPAPKAEAKPAPKPAPKSNPTPTRMNAKPKAPHSQLAAARQGPVKPSPTPARPAPTPKTAVLVPSTTIRTAPPSPAKPGAAAMTSQKTNRVKPAPKEVDIEPPTFRLVHSCNLQGELEPCG